MLKRKEKKSKPLREGRKLHERVLSGVLAAATALSFVPVPEVKAEEIAQIDSSVTPNYFSMPSQINLSSSYNNGDASYLSTLTGNTHYIYKAQFEGAMGIAEGLCAHAGETLNTGNPWTLDVGGYVNGVDLDHWPLWINMLDYYWGFLANQEEIEAICNLTGESPITDYGYGTTKGDARYELGLWPYWSSTTNGGVSFYDASQKIRSQAQAIYWWIDNMRRDVASGAMYDWEWDAYVDNLREHDEAASGIPVSSITSVSEYVPTYASSQLIEALAAEKIQIETKWATTGHITSVSTLSDAIENTKRMIYYTLVIHKTSDPAKPSSEYDTIYSERYNINYGLYLPSTYSGDNAQPFLIGVYDFYMDPVTVTGSWHSAVGVNKVDGSKF